MVKNGNFNRSKIVDSVWALPGCNHDHQDDMKQFPARNLDFSATITPPAPKLWVQQKLTVSQPELNGLKHTLDIQSYLLRFGVWTVCFWGPVIQNVRRYSTGCLGIIHTADGRNPASPGKYKTL